MTAGAKRVFSIPPGLPFLPTLVEALLAGRLVPDFRWSGEPLALADATILVPTRRAARSLRADFVEALGGNAAILPSIRPLGEFDEEADAFVPPAGAGLRLDPPLPAIDRLLLLAPLVRRWKQRLPAHLAARYAEPFTVPASTSDAIWLARDLCALLDEIETEGADRAALAGLVDGELAGWWELTLEFLTIVTEAWPSILSERGMSDPAAWRNAMIDAETARLATLPPRGPVIAAGSTGSIPATARLLATIAGLDRGAVVLPGLDRRMDEESWAILGRPDAAPSVHGHPQYGLRRLLDRLGVTRDDVVELGDAAPALAARAALVGEALRPAETSDAWAARKGEIASLAASGALDRVGLVEAANEREEAIAIAMALRLALEGGSTSSALVTADRGLGRRVAAELRRFGIRADDSGGTPLAPSAPAGLFRLMIEAMFRPGDPVTIVSALKHPLLRLGMTRAEAREAAATVELVALRGHVGRPDIGALAADFEMRLAAIGADSRKPFWWPRLDEPRLARARQLLTALSCALAPLNALRYRESVTLADMLEASVTTFEALGRDPETGLAELYDGDAGEAFAGFLSSLFGSRSSLDLSPAEWPDIVQALLAGEVVKPPQGADPRVSILGTLEARLQSFDFLVIGGLNEGSWPRRIGGDLFMSRLMKAGIDLEPPERRIGLAAHDFAMAAGSPDLLLSRSMRAGDAPAVASRWLQRLMACAGEEAAGGLRRRGNRLLAWARAIDEGPRVAGAARPRPTPPIAARPRHFTVTEIETLRRDPYAVYARRVLRLNAIEPLLRDPGAAERGNLFHEILHRFARLDIDPRRADALDALLSAARGAFADEALPPDIEAVWWPRFLAMAPELLEWERSRDFVQERLAEANAEPREIGVSGITLRGRADRVDLLAAGRADILDFKTGSSPSLRQAHMLVAPQLALEAALLARGAFAGAGQRVPADLAHVRLKADGSVNHESILEFRKQPRSAPDLAQDAWMRLEKLVAFYADPANGYISRALPFREGDTSGDYDHLARVLEWSAGATAESGGSEE